MCAPIVEKIFTPICSSPSDFPRPFPWWTFRIFFIFSARGGGRGSLRRREGGSIFIENPRRGFSRRGRGRGAGRVSAGELGEFGGGEGGYIFFFGAEMSHQVFRLPHSADVFMTCSIHCQDSRKRLKVLQSPKSRKLKATQKLWRRCPSQRDQHFR